jgi:hypothetical protein
VTIIFRVTNGTSEAHGKSLDIFLIFQMLEPATKGSQETRILYFRLFAILLYMFKTTYIIEPPLVLVAKAQKRPEARKTR